MARNKARSRKEKVVWFWSKVNKGQDNECWPWKGGCNNKGYGKFFYDGKLIQAHRLAWIFTNGPIPGGLLCLHHCDNPPCCNPAHLFPGTQSDNVRDMVIKGRHSFIGLATNPILSHEDVLSIRIRYGATTRKELACEYNCSTTTISSASKGILAYKKYPLPD